MRFLETNTAQDRITWRLARPERGNGLGTILASELADALAALTAELAQAGDDDAALRPLVLCAKPLVKGDRATWIAGGDLKELAALPNAAAAAEYAGLLGRVCAGLARLPCPVVAAIDGMAIGGGAELALWCDERIATQRSGLAFKQLAVGLACGYGTTRRLVDLVGLAKAQHWLFRTATLDATRASAAGLFDEVVADEAALEDAVRAAVARWRGLAPRAVRAQKAMLWHAVNSHPGAARSAELELFQGAWGNPHHKKFLSEFGA